MRIHGDKHLTRREMPELRDYHQAKELLREDFAGICGYCGKNSRYLPYNYEIDHFVPRSVAPEWKNEYRNMVFSCRKCNLAKGHKWPTKDKNLPNNGEIGFVDPVREEYDLHLSREDNGRIVYKTALGKYMYDQFHFNLRRTELFWEIERLYGIEEKFEELNREGRLMSEEKDFYFRLNEQLKEISRILAAQGE